jgi:hypothetical protein
VKKRPAAAMCEPAEVTTQHHSAASLFTMQLKNAADTVRKSSEKSKLRFKTIGRGRCLVCRKPLQRVGTDRANGVRHHGDWADRRYHKKCLKQNPNLSIDGNWVKTLDIV